MGAQLSHEPPLPLPGGYTVREQVYFTGESHTFESGDQLEHGKQGEVVGPATFESLRGKGVRVRFPGNTGTIRCRLTAVRRRRHRRAATHRAPHRAPALPILPAHHTTGGVWARR